MSQAMQIRIGREFFAKELRELMSNLWMGASLRRTGRLVTITKWCGPDYGVPKPLPLSVLRHGIASGLIRCSCSHRPHRDVVYYVAA